MSLNTRSAWLVLGSLLLASGCRVRAAGFIEPPPPVTVQATVAAPPPPQAQATVAVNWGAPTAQIQVIEATCTQGAQEQCNGLDDNCNGQIDEGCGYQSGAIQITLAWNTGADIDMYVTDPSGETISYQDRNSASGGFLDHDARGNCDASSPNNRIENVYWTSPTPPSGAYTLALHYYGECNSGAGATQVTVSIAIGGRVQRAFNLVLQPNERQTVSQFTI